MNRLLTAILSTTVILVAQAPPDFTPPTPLFGALLGGDQAALTRLLDSGADPNEARFLGAPPLTVALMQQNPEAARMLLGKGAKIDAVDMGGSSALMWAAAMEVPDASMVKELLDRGADPNFANTAGDTALTWALRRGYTPAVEMLKKHGASDSRMIRSSVERTVSLLLKSAPEFVKVSGCSSCHNQSLPQMTFALARQRGIHVDPQIAGKQVKTVIATVKPFHEAMAKGLPGLPNPAISLSYLLLGLAAEGYGRDETTDAMANLVSVQQGADGRFAAFAARPPMESSSITATAVSIRALQTYGTDAEGRIEKAREWLRTASPRTNEEKTMKLLGLTWAKADKADLRAAAEALLADQRPDGGWAQLVALESDAYATGQTLFALNASGILSTTDEPYQRGTAYLLRTQRQDGSWLVRSRTFPFQPYKESGFPHGKDQWISAAGSSWAAMALLNVLPPADSTSGGGLQD